jgi:hypothetical protein
MTKTTKAELRRLIKEETGMPVAKNSTKPQLERALEVFRAQAAKEKRRGEIAKKIMPF